MRMPGKSLSNGHHGRNGAKGRHDGSKASKRSLLAAVTAAYAGGGISSGSVNRKISGPVPYEHVLDLGKYAARSDGDDDDDDDGGGDDNERRQRSSYPPLKYRLSSVVAHAGMLNDGHYTLIASRPSINSSGFVVVNLDDESVSRAQKRDLLDPPGGFTPYILTYVRMTDEADSPVASTD